MADITTVQLPDGSTHNVKDNTSGYATTAYVDSEIGSLTKSSIGLGNVDNTSDLNKPVSTAQQTALNAKANNSLVAYVESTTTATRRYEIGDHFILNGVRYKATAIIANGGTITVGTNCTASDTVSEELEKSFVLTNQTLTFSNLVATVSDARVTADTYAMVFFNDATLQAAANAGVVVDTSAGTITFTAATAPSSNLVCDIVCRKG